MESQENEEIPWDEVVVPASKMFNTWLGGGELEWAQECWRHFNTMGLLDSQTCLGSTRSFLLLVALAKIYQEFCGRAWDENSETPLGDLAEDLDLDGVALGILAARAAPEIVDWDGDDFELRDYALGLVTDAMRKEIHECLCGAYGGEIALYSRMYHTRNAPEEGCAEEFEVTGANASALHFVQSQFFA